MSGLVNISEHVWIWPRDMDPDLVQGTVGVIVTEAETVLVDSGNSLLHARRIRDAIAAKGWPAASRIIYTHHHWDHVFGAMVFNAPVTAHALSGRFLQEMQTVDWSDSYLRDRVEQNPALKTNFTAADWASLQLVLPQVTFTETLHIPLSGVTLELLHVGGKHAADSIVVKVVEDGVIFLGDCYYPPPVYEATEDDMIDFEMLARIVTEPYQIYIDGHKAIFKKRHLQRIIRSPHLVTQLKR